MISYDAIEYRQPAVDLLYPSPEKRSEMKKRAAQLERLPQDYIANLELERLAQMISPHNSYHVLNMIKQLTSDPQIINYRLDILEDIMNIPRLASTVKKMIEIISENDRRSIYKLSEPDSFSALDNAICAFDAYVQCVELMCGFFEENKSLVKSDGVKKMFDFFEQSRKDVHFEKLRENVDELKKAIESRIKSVTVAINFDEHLRPSSAGVVDISPESYNIKPSLFDRIFYSGSKLNDKNIVIGLRKRYSDTDSGETIESIADKKLFEELDFLTEGYVKMTELALREYQKIDFEDAYALEYQLEFYMGAADLIGLCKSAGMGMCRPKLLDAGERRADVRGLYDLIYFSECRLYNIRNADKKQVVANDISFDDSARFFLLTGANNGGKTTFLRAFGICQTLAQLGIYVPAESCEISPVDFIYTQFPKEEQTGINASRFTTEIKQFKEISDTITPYSLLLLNESIQSTTPSECVDIASELVRIFTRIGVRGIFATHIIELARKAEEFNEASPRSKVCSIVAQTDADSGQRLYKIVKGQPKNISMASGIFKQFGIDIEKIENRLKSIDKN